MMPHIRFPSSIQNDFRKYCVENQRVGCIELSLRPRSHVPQETQLVRPQSIMLFSAERQERLAIPVLIILVQVAGFSTKINVFHATNHLFSHVGGHAAGGGDGVLYGLRNFGSFGQAASSPVFLRLRCLRR